MLRANFQPIADAAHADYHIINSCAFIEAARQETIETVLSAAEIKKSPRQKLILAGCFSERYSKSLSSWLPEVDLQFGTGLYHRAGELIANAFGAPLKKAGQQIPSAAAAILPTSGRPYAPLKISDGCDRGCSFCAIPLFRGPYRFLELDEIKAECQRLLAEGVREVCLVSQDTNRYGGSVDAFLKLLSELHDLSALRWIRLLYMYPDSLTEAIFQKIGQEKWTKLVPYLESPVQHVSPSLLRSMRRSGNYDRYLEIFAVARQSLPGLELRTSFLIGFPGEKESDVELLLRFLHDARPEKLALFAYSAEEGRPTVGDTIDPVVVAERINRLREEHLTLLKEMHRQRVGRIYSCMVDSVGAQYLLARRPQDAPDIDEVVFVERENNLSPRDIVAGDIVDIEIGGFCEYDMMGTFHCSGRGEKGEKGERRERGRREGERREERREGGRREIA